MTREDDREEIHDGVHGEGLTGGAAPAGMVPCTVQMHQGAMLVTFDDGRDLLLQADYEQADFCLACGLLDQDLGSADRLGDLMAAFADCDPTGIEFCPEEYLEAAE